MPPPWSEAELSLSVQLVSAGEEEEELWIAPPWSEAELSLSVQLVSVGEEKEEL